MGTGRLYDVWVADGGSNTVSKIVNDVIVKTISVGSNYASDICIDKNNVVWVANGSNLTKIVNNVVEKTITFSGAYPTIMSICVDKNNTIWVAVNSYTNWSKCIYKIVNDTIDKTIDLGSQDTPIDICVDKNNAIWAVLYNQNNQTRKLIKIVGDVIVKTIDGGVYYRICIDKNNVVWVASGNGLTKIVNDVIVKTITTDSSIGCICIDKNNVVWAGAANKIYKINNDILEDTIGISTSPISISIDKDNAVWALSSGDYRCITKIVNGKVAKTITSGLAVYPQNLSTGMEWELLFGSKHLLQSGSTLKSFDGNAFSTVGSIPLTDAMFESGFSDFTGLTKEKLATLESPKILTKKSESVTSNTKYTGTPLPKVIVAKNDITLSDNTSKIDKFALTATLTGSSNLRIAFSLDSGTTWKSYKSNILTTIDISNLNDFKTNGNTLTEFNAIVDWNTIITNKKIRFAYYLEVNDITDTVYTDLLTMQVDMNGIWKLIDTPDYQYYYGKDNELTINLLSDGDYRLNI